MKAARILIVEDEQITATDINDTLEELGYKVLGVVSSGRDALRKVEQTPADLVLMDIRIKGDLDGIDTARELRQRFDIPVVYLTAHADEETLARAKQAEPLGYVVKPFQESELRASIEMALHKHQLDREAKERESLLSETLSAIGEGVIRIDSRGAVTYLNPAAETWTGWKQGDAVGANIQDVFRIINQRDRQPSGEFIMRTLRDGVVAGISGGCVLMGKNGVERPVSGSIAPLRDVYGRISGAVLVFGKQSSEPVAAAPSRVEDQPGRQLFRADKVEIVAASGEMRETMKFAGRVAASGVTTILLQGESGTGKDVLAKFLHYQSERRDQPFVAINCAAIPETLLESELFGHERGAFTDARAMKKGVLELAHGGTVLLDEIGELELHLQAKLLRVLEEQSFRRLGGVRDVGVDVRVVASTNRNLGEAVRKREFREDLFYRINVIQILIPPLRDRKDDILPLADYFIEAYNRKFRRNIAGVSPQAAELLLSHNWPGNVRELRNAVERAMVLEETSLLQPVSLAIGTESIAPPDERSGSSDALPQGLSLEETEKAMLMRALEKTGGNQTRAARMLGITRDTLRYRIKKFDLR